MSTTSEPLDTLRTTAAMARVVTYLALFAGGAEILRGDFTEALVTFLVALAFAALWRTTLRKIAQRK